MLILIIFGSTGLLFLLQALRLRIAQDERDSWTLLPHRIYIQKTLNSGAGFALPIPRRFLLPASLLGIASILWNCAVHPLSSMLILAGGLSNLLERIHCHSVLDYLHFPKAPGKLKNFVYNAADLCLFVGLILTLLPKKKRR